MGKASVLTSSTGVQSALPAFSAAHVAKPVSCLRPGAIIANPMWSEPRDAQYHRWRT